MKLIEYRASYNTGDGSSTDIVKVRARSINAGWSRAARLALQGLPSGWELITLEFWQVV